MRTALIAAGLLTLSTAPAAADSGALFAESARAVSLADAVVARPGDTSAIYFNPAGLAAMDRATLTLLGHAGTVRLRFARDGELPDVRDRLVGGYGASVVARMPGPEWLQRVRLAGSIALPAESLIRVVVPVRTDQPVSPYYGGRTARTSATFALAVELPWTLELGAALTVAPTLFAPTAVGFDASRGETADEGVFVEQARVLALDVSAILGARIQPLPELGFGLVWRQGAATRASGDLLVQAGAIRVADEYRFYDLLSPEEVAFGLLIAPTPEVSVSLDATWARWSEYRTLHDERPEPGFSDVVDVRAGLEWRAHPAVAARLGYAFLPSPVPAQTGRHNFVDAHRHEIAFGAGLDLEPLVDAPVRIDGALRFHALHAQTATKDAPAPGSSIDNLGYPGFRASGSFMQVSLSLTIALSGAAAASGEEHDAAEEPTIDEPTIDGPEVAEPGSEAPHRTDPEADEPDVDDAGSETPADGDAP